MTDLQRTTENMNAIKHWYATYTNPDNERGALRDVIKGADLFLGLSVPNVITVNVVKTMSPHPLVFAMANPVPEIMPENVYEHVAVMATGRSDYPNQINNVLCFRECSAAPSPAPPAQSTKR